MLKLVLLYATSVLLTGIFSYSLQSFMQDGLIMFSLKTMLIPCFTWIILIISGYIKIRKEKRLGFLQLTGFVCAWGSAVLVPAGIYNFLASDPEIMISVTSVFASVLLMSVMFYKLLPSYGMNRSWWWAFNILICINMTLFYLAANS